MEEIRNRVPVCPHGSPYDLDLYLLVSLEKLEHALGLQLEYISGYRCKPCNEAAGGVENSAHLRGKAVDIECKESGLRYYILWRALGRGFNRVGIKKGAIHLDVDFELPQHVLWLYE